MLVALAATLLAAAPAPVRIDLPPAPPLATLAERLAALPSAPDLRRACDSGAARACTRLALTTPADAEALRAKACAAGDSAACPTSATTTPDAGEPTLADCRARLATLSDACQQGKTVACADAVSLVIPEPGGDEACATLLTVDAIPGGTLGFQLLACAGAAPDSCDRLADALDDLHLDAARPVLAFRRRISLLLRACTAANTAACTALRDEIAEDPRRLLVDPPVRPRPLPAEVRALFEAIAARDFAAVRLLVRRDKPLASVVDASGTTALEAALRRDDDRTALELVRAGAKTDPLLHGVPALTLALFHDARETVGALMKGKFPANPEVEAPELSPLSAAIDTGRLDVARTLLKKGALVPESLLGRVVDAADLESLAVLLGSKVPAGALDRLLPRAVQASPDAALLLLQKGAKPAASGLPLVRLALRNGEKSLVRALLAAGGDAKTAAGDWPLVPAVAEADESLVREFIRRGAKTDAVDSDSGLTPLAVAVQVGHDALVDTLLDLGASPDTVLRDGETTLSAALRTGQLGIARRLLDAGAPPDRASNGVTPLHVAVQQHLPEFVTLLLAKGAARDPPLPGTLATPLHLAAESGDLAIATLLVDAGADRTRRLADGRTPAELVPANAPELLQILAVPDAGAPARKER